MTKSVEQNIDHTTPLSVDSDSKMKTEIGNAHSNNQEVYKYTPPPINSNQKKGTGVFGVLRLFISIIITLLVPIFFCVLPIGSVIFFSYISSNITGVSTEYTIKENPISETGNSSSSKISKIAVINVNDEIYYSTPGTAIDTSSSNSESIIAQLDYANNDDDVKSIVMRWNSPGGALSAAEPICRKMQEVNSNKTIYSFIDTTGASLAYLLPNCGSEIFARESSITGSIGVIIQYVDFLGILEHFGGRIVTITNTEGDQKSGEGIFEENSETYKNYQAILDEGYNYFIDKIVEGRKGKTDLTKEDIIAISDGRIFSGKQALEAGLVDFNSEFEETLDSILKLENIEDTKVNVVEYTIPVNPFGQLFGETLEMMQASHIENELESKSQIKLMAILR